MNSVLSRGNRFQGDISSPTFGSKILLDPEVKSWASAIRGNGGSVSVSVLREVNKFVRGCKADGVWDLMLDVGLFAGVDNLAGALVKLKTPAGVQRVLTNNNFVSADYTASGSSAGLVGNGTSKYLNTGLIKSAADITLGIYVTQRNTAVGVYAASLAAVDSITDRGLGLYQKLSLTPGSGYASWLQENTVTVFNLTGFPMVSSTGSALIPYFNGTARTPTATLTLPTTSSGFALFRAAAGRAADWGNDKLSFYMIGNSITAAQAAALSTHVNTLMTAFGCNTY